MSLADSQSVFWSRCEQLKLLPFKEKFVEKGWTTYGDFAYATGQLSGQVPDEEFRTKVVAELTGDARHGLHTKIVRLHFEAYSAAFRTLRRSRTQIGQAHLFVAWRMQSGGTEWARSSAGLAQG